MPTSLHLLAGLRLVIASLVASVAASGLAAPAAAEPAPPPLSAFFSGEAIHDVKLSPSGRHLAIAMADETGRVLLAVTDAEMTQKLLVVASAPFADIRSFEWVNDDWLVYNVADLQSAGYDQDFGPGLFSVRRDGSQARLLVNARWGTQMTTGTLIANNRLDPSHRLLEVLRDGSHDVIVGAYAFNARREVESIVPKRLDVETGRTTRILDSAPGYAVSWVFDSTGAPRTVTTTHDGSVEVFWRGPSDPGWRSLQKAATFHSAWWPLAVDASNRLYVQAASAESTAVLKRFDFGAGQPETDALATAPGFDLDADLVLGDGRRRLTGVRVRTDAESTLWFDPTMKSLQALADARFPNRVNRLTCETCQGDGALLVQSFADHDPGMWSVYRPKTGTWTPIGSARPAVDPRLMSDLDLHRIKARDGLELPVWVTRSRTVKGPSPAVLLVHGGPWTRGVHWKWHADAQFLASRGYTVIEPEYRSSTGYGTALFRAGWKHWGTTMQDDLADAVRWAADQKLIDPARVCIAGASYGGYAALMAPIRYPEMFKCSVSWLAVADPQLMFADLWASDVRQQDLRYTLPTLIGDPLQDAALLKAASPLERAAELKVPLLLAYGEEDRRVPIEHGNRMRAALKAAGREPDFIVYPGEGHGFLKPAHRLDFYARVEAFLKRHLGSGDGSPH